MHADTVTPFELDDADTQANDNARLPALMRGAGAAALAIGMYIFLMKGWEHGSDLLRYFIMLAHTVVLAGAGLLSGHWLKESKGARLLVVLALASIPANFAILGGFIYSQVHFGSAHNYPNYMSWSLDSLPLALGVTAFALIALIPVAHLGFKVLARAVSRPLCWLFIASNSLLLLPVRDAHWISMLAIVMAVAHLFCNQRFFARHIAGKTREGIIALSLLCLPLLMLLGRNMWLYDASFFVSFTNTILAYLLLRRFSLSLDSENPARQILDLLAAFVAMSLCSLPTGMLYYADQLSLSLSMPLCMLPAAMMLYDISMRNEPGRSFFRGAATLVYASHFLGYLFLFDGPAATQLCLLAGLVGATLGYQQGQRSLFLAGVLVAVIGAVRNLFMVYAHFNLGGWLTLAILGIGLILLASWIEARGNVVRHYMNSLRSRYADWEF